MNLIFNKLIDLTHTLDAKSICWDTDCGFQQHIIKDYPENACRVQKLEMFSGAGTHMDAPAHFILSGDDIASISLEKLIVPSHVIDVSEKCLSDYFVSVEDLNEYEKNWGRVSENSIVIFYTGWSRYWKDSKKYRNEDEKGIFRIPGVDVSVIEILLQRQILGIAIDTLSPDGSNMKFPVHHLLLENGKYIVENVANANQLPPAGSHVIVLPLKIEGGTEAPVRMVGLV